MLAGFGAKPLKRIFALTATAVMFAQAGAAAAPRSAQEKLSEWASPDDYFVAGEIDATFMFKRALARHKQVRGIPGKQYIVSPQMGLMTPEGTFGICIALESDNQLIITGVKLKQRDGTGGEGAIISNTAPIVGASVVGGTIDCNRANTTGNMSAVLFFNAKKSIIDTVDVSEIRWIGAGFRNLAEGFGDNHIHRCSITGSNYIGVQCRQPTQGVRITFNTISFTADNGIDIEGNNPGGAMGIGGRILIHGNSVSYCTTPCFLESVGNATVTANYFFQFNAAGIYCNRINTPAAQILITENHIHDGAGFTGIFWTSSTGRALIANNYFRNLGRSVFCAFGAGEITMGVNQHENIATYLVEIPRGTNNMVKSRIQEQTYIGARINGFPFTTSPLTNPANSPGRSFAVAVAPTCYLETGSIAATAAAEYIYSTGVLDTNPGWGAYSIFSTFYNPAGETLVYEGSDNIGGGYITINGTMYRVGPQRGAGVFAINGMDGSSGNYAAALNGAYAWTAYFSPWMDA